MAAIEAKGFVINGQQYCICSAISADYAINDAEGNEIKQYTGGTGISVDNDTHVISYVGGGGGGIEAVQHDSTLTGDGASQTTLLGVNLAAIVPAATLPIVINDGYITNNGTDLTVTGENAWGEGKQTSAIGIASHAEGGNTYASSYVSHAEGSETIAGGSYSHAEGGGTKALGSMAHSEGEETSAVGNAVHVEGGYTYANTYAAHAEGEGTSALAHASHAAGLRTIANQQAETVIGKYNVDTTGRIFQVGIGTANNSRKDAFYITTAGTTHILSGNTVVDLSGSLNNLQSEIDTVDTKITNETTAREASETALGTRILNAETSVANETTARVAADTTLQQAIDNINVTANDPFVTVTASNKQFTIASKFRSETAMPSNPEAGCWYFIVE